MSNIDPENDPYLSENHSRFFGVGGHTTNNFLPSSSFNKDADPDWSTWGSAIEPGWVIVTLKAAEWPLIFQTYPCRYRSGIDINFRNSPFVSSLRSHMQYGFVLGSCGEQPTFFSNFSNQFKNSVLFCLTSSVEMRSRNRIVEGFAPGTSSLTRGKVFAPAILSNVPRPLENWIGTFLTFKVFRIRMARDRFWWSGCRQLKSSIKLSYMRRHWAHSSGSINIQVNKCTYHRHCHENREVSPAVFGDIFFFLPFPSLPVPP